MTKLTFRDYKLFAALLTLDAVGAAAVTVWALVEALTGGPAAAWWPVPLGVAVSLGTAVSAAWFLRRAAQAGQGGAR
jgi:hypothetical protein